MFEGLLNDILNITLVLVYFSWPLLPIGYYFQRKKDTTIREEVENPVNIIMLLIALSIISVFVYGSFQGI